jgi:hypothetical protein
MQVELDRHLRPNTKTAQTSWAVLVFGCGDTQLPIPTFASDRSLKEIAPENIHAGTDGRQPKRCAGAAAGTIDMGPEAVYLLLESTRLKRTFRSG